MRNYIYTAKPRRVYFLDELRGGDIIAMVIYHALYDLVAIFGVSIPVFGSFAMHLAQSLIAGVFIVLSGIACRYSKSNAKRGLITFLLGLLLTAVTLLFIPEQAIYFGILHFLGAAMLLFALLHNALDKISPVAGIILFVALFAVLYNLPNGYIGIAAWRVALPKVLYSQHFLLPMGFGGMGSDYFPLLPWLALFFAGSYLGVFFLEDGMPGWFYKKRCNWLAALGRRTIIVYLLHQPVIFGVLTLLFMWIRR